MTDDLPRLLKTMTIAELKSVAKESSVDVSSCRNKKSYINAIISAGVTEEQVKSALGAGAEKREEEAKEMEEIERDLKDISEKPSEPKELPEGEDVVIERSVDQALMLRPLFFEVDTATEQAWDRMILGDFSEAISLNRESRSQVIDRLSNFHLYSTALSIRASETLLRQMKGIDVKTSSEIKTALAEAKKAFMHGPPKRRETTLEELESLIMKALKAHLEKSEQAEEELRRALEEYASFGTHVNGPNEILEIAVQAKNSFDVEQYVGLLGQAKAQADRARAARMKEIEDAFEHVRMAIDAAREAGVDTSEGEARYNDARTAFNDSNFVRAMQLLAGIEQAVDNAHLQRVRQDRDTEAKEIAQITSSIQEAEPDLEEAALYGMDVREGLLFVRTTKTALQQRDVVTAAKFSRRVRKLTKSMEKDLGRLRERHLMAKGVTEAPGDGAKNVEPTVKPAGQQAEATNGKEKKWKGLLNK
jgi:tetratricopeptide (TPR) repeat protein